MTQLLPILQQASLLLVIVLLLVGLKQLSSIVRALHTKPSTSSGWGLLVPTNPDDLGQHTPEVSLTDQPTGLTTDELEWARELGATTLEETIDLVRKHEESVR